MFMNLINFFFIFFQFRREMALIMNPFDSIKHYMDTYGGQYEFSYLNAR